ncbi:histidine phosphatase family protein [Litorihabitans aurantiacus]|uniref:Fructose 1,6-bisphosphatase n=1 Tax=Litorihabitans aurantiacus TaxID=1930061 RepID=A0AA37UHZ7_9MICO|nr:histidine phosphatase family protein [Litorihabitans aurantiacus]GMA30879.1 fructose 1,6-bisphosphatase [Litorihabitans aurantiacus]
MTAGTVVLLRHGQTDYNVAMRLQGQTDIPLNETGRAQAAEAASVVAGLSPTAIVASDLSRAADTAAAVADLLELPVTTDPRLRERDFGEWEGLHGDVIAERWPDDYALWRGGGHPESVGAERRGEVGVRFAAGVADAASALSSDDTLLVVAHGACIAAGITAMLGLDADDWGGISGLGNCHWSVLTATEREPGWRLGAHNVGA